jgi:hypothetical protein
MREIFFIVILVGVIKQRGHMISRMDRLIAWGLLVIADHVDQGLGVLG